MTSLLAYQQVNLKEYIIDISKSTCWNQVILDHKNEILNIIKIIKPMYSSYLKYLKFGLWIYSFFDAILYENEIKEIAKILDISFEECLLIKL